MKTLAHGLRLAAMLAAGALAGCASSGVMQVREVGSYHVGGKPVTLTGLPIRELSFTPGAAPIKIDPNGDFEVEQMYVRYTRLAEPRAKHPMLMWHGGGLTGVTWETKPDGGAGWESFFLTRGHDVYVSDAVERGRASWARFPEIFKGEPFFRTKKEGWELFRIGETGSYVPDASVRKPIPGTQFPTQAFDQFMKQGVPRWGSTDAAIQAAYDAYVQKACPCVIVVHSQGGNFAFAAALKAPEKIKAIVAVETSGSPDPATADYARLKGIPMLWVWGDNLEKFPFWGGILDRQERFRKGVIAAGGTGDLLRLPDAGMRGNSHMLMMDRNSDQAAAAVQAWLEKQGLMR